MAEQKVNLRKHLVQLCCKSGAVDDAIALIRTVHLQNVLLWNAVIQAHDYKKQGKEILQLFDQMQQEGVIPDKVTFARVLSACAGQIMLSEGKRVHACILCGKLKSNLIVRTALVNMYGKCGSLKDALDVFETSPETDVVAWNAMVTAYVQHGQGREALHVFKQMQQQAVMPNRVTYITVIEACAIHAVQVQGKQIHTCIFGNELEADVAIINELINMYGKCGSLEDAWMLFEGMPKRDMISWNVMIAAYAQLGQGQKALELFDPMIRDGFMADKFTFTSLLSACATEAGVKKGKHLHACILYSEVKLDVFLGTALLKMYGNCGMVEVAQKLFNNMTEPTLILWNALIAVYTQCGCNKEALAVFHQMQQEGVIPDKVTHVNALSACANEPVLFEGKEMHACIVESGFLSDIVVGTALVNMYGKCGMLEEARIIFDRMPRHNVVCWNAIMAVYSQHGQGEVILQFFDQMQEEVVPDDLTFVSILSGCSHSGLVENGLHCFASIHQVYGIAPTIVHYVCVIDLLGRAGQLDKAEGLMNCISCLNNTVSFTALLGACKCSADVERGERVVKEILKVYPDRASPTVMLTNIYSAAGKGSG